ncbi:MAG: glycosyltransferase family 39 protein [Candidatus Sumerlaeia bacterium]|nr:glycosyltransferase family 39 protein [Candidatus Sumerlaeia bacterium]
MEKRSRAVLWGLLAVGAILRAIGLGSKSLWVDEIHSVCVSSSLEQILYYCRGGHTPPLRYFLVWVLLVGDNPELWVRLPAAVLGTLTIPLVFWIGKMLWDWRAGLVAAALLTVSPEHVAHSQDARYYAIILFLALAALGLAVQIVREPEKRWRWAALALVCVLNLYISYVAVFPSLGVGGYLLFCLVRAARQKEGKAVVQKMATGMALASAVAFVLFLPWLGEIFGVFRRYATENPTPEARPATTAKMPVVPVHSPTAWKTPLNWAYANDFLARLGATQPVLKWALFAAALTGSVLWARRDRALAVLLFGWFFLPWAIILETGMRYFCPPRYLIHYLGVYVLLAATTVVWISEMVDRIWARRAPNLAVLQIGRAILGVALVLAGLLAAAAFLREDIRYHSMAKQDWLGAVDFLDEHAQASDVVVAGGYWSPLGLSYYGGELSKPLNLIGSYSTAARIEKEMRLYPRVWYVTWGPINPDIADMLARRFTLMKVFPGSQGDVLIYFSRPPAVPRAAPKK